MKHKSIFPLILIFVLIGCGVEKAYSLTAHPWPYEKDCVEIRYSAEVWANKETPILIESGVYCRIEVPSSP